MVPGKKAKQNPKPVAKKEKNYFDFFFDPAPSKKEHVAGTITEVWKLIPPQIWRYDKERM